MSQFYTNAIFLPRQARDKHMECTQKRLPFLSGNCIPEALSLIDSDTEAVVLVLGIDGNVEHEGVDRTDTAPPGLQMPFAQV